MGTMTKCMMNWNANRRGCTRDMSYLQQSVPRGVEWIMYYRMMNMMISTMVITMTMISMMNHMMTTITILIMITIMTMTMITTIHTDMDMDTDDESYDDNDYASYDEYDDEDLQYGYCSDGTFGDYGYDNDE